MILLCLISDPNSWVDDARAPKGGVVRVHFAEIGSDVSPGMPMMLGRYRDIDSRNERFRISAFQNISNF